MAHERLRTFGRTKSRSLKPRQARLMQTLLPQLAPPPGPFDPKALKPDVRAVWLEAGFGAGEHLVGQAARASDALFLGAEPFVNGLAACLAQVDDLRLGNVRLEPGDARALMGRLPDACLDRLIVLFPDPWPKRRHHKRRLVSPAFVAEAARLLKRGGLARLATDWADYANAMLLCFTASPHFRWTAERADDWRAPPADHIATRYEQKRLGDTAPIWLEFERR